MIGFILSLIVGGLIGWLGQVIMKTDVPGGVFGNIVVGFIGAWLGSLLLGDWGWTVQGFAVFPAIIGSLLVVLVYGLIAKR